jgi:dTDP-4-dehydrorhamnose reductase
MGRIIVIGASGMIGTELLRQACHSGCEIVGTYATRPADGLWHFDLTKHGLLDVVPDLGPNDTVLMLSAIIDQAWVEEHPDEAYCVNAEGAMLCAAVAAKRQAHFVFMSSEAVLWKWKTAYGAQKVLVENYVSEFGSNWCIVRTGSVVGWRPQDRRCTISKTYDALLVVGAKMAPDNFFTITDVEDVACGLLRVAERGICGDVNLAANPPMSRTQLADEIMAASAFRQQMGYEQATRPQPHWLYNESARALGCSFALPGTTVKRKVALLDSQAFVEREALLDHVANVHVPVGPVPTCREDIWR